MPVAHKVEFLLTRLHSLEGTLVTTSRREIPSTHQDHLPAASHLLRRWSRKSECHSLQKQTSAPLIVSPKFHSCPISDVALVIWTELHLSFSILSFAILDITKVTLTFTQRFSSF
ncbi:UNVERIFIED_CONTAM: hypothetical protein K2H54_044947 [Gekko kuhli]